MRSITIKLLFGAAICLLPFQSQSQSALTLEEAVTYGVENSDMMKTNQLDIMRAEAQIKEYRAIGLPQISGSVEYSHFIKIPTSLIPAENFGGEEGEFAELKFGLKNSLNAGVSMNTLLFDGSFFTGLKAQRIYRELVQKQVDQTKFDIRKNVTKAYMAVLIAQRNQEMLDKNISVLEKSLAETKIMYETGFIEKLDVDRLQLSFDNLNTEYSKVARLIRLSINVLKFQMNFPYQTELVLNQNLDDLVDEVLIAEAITDGDVDISARPELAILDATIRLQELNIEVNKKRYLPSLVGFASYQQALSRNNLFSSSQPGFFPTSVVGLNLSIPIWDGFDKRSKIQMAKIDHEKAILDKQKFEYGVGLEVYNARLNYENARATVGSTESSQNLAESIYNTAKIKFTEGVGSSIEMTQAETNLYTSQTNYINALYDLVVAKTDLDLATGK